MSRAAHVAGLAARVLVFAALVVALHFFIDWAMARAEASARSGMLTAGLVAVFLVVYAALIAVPFVPGIEIGLSLLALRGADVAPFVYAATWAGLMLAYGAGRALSLAWLEGRLHDFRLGRAARFVGMLAPLDRQARLDILSARLPGRLAPHLLRWRYPLLALLVNLPGSGLVGGGGGLCLVAGLSGVFGPRGTALTLALAVAPVPLLVWWLGLDARSLLIPV